MTRITDKKQGYALDGVSKVIRQTPCQDVIMNTRLTLVETSPDVATIENRPQVGSVYYKTRRKSEFKEMSTVAQIYLRDGKPTQIWHEEVGDLLARRYELAGWSRAMFMQDWSTLRRVCGDRHPSEIFLQDLELQILRGQTQSSRESYVGRMKSIFNSLRLLGIIPMLHRPDDGLPRIKVSRNQPRPLSREQVLSLIDNAQGEVKEWFTLAALTGMRAMEVARIEGVWLENIAGNPMLRINGKGKTQLVVPAHPQVVEIIKSKNTLGRLYHIEPNYLSRKTCAEMRRQGIMTKHNKNRDGSRLSFHSFRHFFATEMLVKTGGNLVTVSKLMRHSSPAVTMIYAGLINNEERTAVNLLFNDVEWKHITPPPKVGL